MAETPNLQLKDIGEQGLLKKLQKYCPADIIGDDAAIVALEPHQSLVITTDMLVDGVHFSDSTTSPEDAGWRAAAANLSDIAAMGASPLALTIGLGLPPHVPVDWIERLYQGLVACLQPYNTPIVGGDVVRSPVITLAITAFGQVNPQQTIKRHLAKPGDVILVTGPHGASRAGLELLINPPLAAALTPSEKAALIQAHQRPQPRLDILPHLWQLLPGTSLAGMDSSDGLADAILQICQNSNVGASINRESLPIPPSLNKIATPEQALNWALYGGEDFELVLCLSETLAQSLVNLVGNSCQIIGQITQNNKIYLTSQNENIPAQELTLERGYQHF